MIIDEGGKYRSIRTREEEIAQLQTDIDRLTPEERDLLKIAIGELTSVTPQLDGGVYHALRNAEYKWDPVDMKTFIYDEYFLGKTCKELYPMLLKELTDIFDGRYNEVIATGAIGWGKSFLASIAMCRILYEISCMRDPHASFGIAAETNISIVALSVSEEQAIKVAFEYIGTKIESSPYFQENFPYKKKKKEIVFPHNVWVAARPSSNNGVLGLNVIAAIMDETNFLPKPKTSVKNRPGKKHDYAQSLYDAIIRRMESRFKKKGKLPGMLFLSSSKQTEEDFTARKIRKAKETGTDSAIYVCDYALWEVKPEDYVDVGYFQVFVGNDVAPSKILEESEVEHVRSQLPDGTAIIDVPEDFRMDFESNLEGAIQDLAGRAAPSVTPYIQRREKIYHAIQKERTHPFTSEIWDMSKGGDFIWERMVGMHEEPVHGGGRARRLRPLVSPRAIRHVHIDPSISGDCSGFAMGHVIGFKNVVRRDNSRRQYGERAPVYYIDFLLQIVPPLNGEIILGEIRELVYDLDAHGYAISRVTQDSYQSMDGIQQLNKKGYTSELVSVDKSIEAYDTLKLALYEDRVLMYGYKPLIEELRTLEKDNKRNKVDHPATGSKDVSDALAACIWTLSQQRLDMALPIVSTSGFSDLAHPQQGHASTLIPGQPAQLTDLISPIAIDGMLPPFLGGGFKDTTDWGGGWEPGSL